MTESQSEKKSEFVVEETLDTNPGVDPDDEVQSPDELPNIVFSDDAEKDMVELATEVFPDRVDDLDPIPE